MMPTWPDLVSLAIVLVFTLKGWKRGFVRELAGAVALVAAVAAAFHYPGTLDGPVRSVTHLGVATAHVLGMVIFCVAVYGALMALASILGRFARLPVISIGNSVAGAAVGACKALAGCWLLLYVALFFPLASDLRGDLHRSTAVVMLTQGDGAVDDLLLNAMPAFVRGFSQPLFATHHV